VTAQFIEEPSCLESLDKPWSSNINAYLHRSWSCRTERYPRSWERFGRPVRCLRRRMDRRVWSGGNPWCWTGSTHLAVRSPDGSAASCSAFRFATPSSTTSWSASRVPTPNRWERSRSVVDDHKGAPLDNARRSLAHW